MSKKITFGPKPSAKSAATTPDAWVDSRTTEATKRLTVDLPASLHIRVKTACAQRGINIKDEICKLLDQHFPKPEQ